MSRIARAIPIVLIAWLAVVAGSAQADGSSAPRAPVALQLKFRSVATDVYGNCGNPVLTSGRYALVSFSHWSCFPRFLLLDDNTGRHAMIRRGCTEDLAFRTPWVLSRCNFQAELYNFRTGRWQQLCGPLRPGCVPDRTFGYDLGTRWLEFDVKEPAPCGDNVHNSCGPVTHSFYNLQTHRSRQRLTLSSTTIVDLDSRTLVRRLCSPLRVPVNGLLSLYGRFAVATEQDGSTFLERCGSRLQVAVGETFDHGKGRAPLYAATHGVIWPLLDDLGFWHGQLAGRLLPSLRAFTTSLPSNIPIAGSGQFALDAFRLYVIDDQGRLWAARY